MKKLLFIFLLLPAITNGQVVISHYGGAYNTLGIGSISGAYTAGRLYILFVGISNTGSAAATVSLSGTGQTWTEIGSAGGITNGGNWKRLQAFMFAPTSNNTDQTNLNYTGSLDGGFLFAVEITGVVTTGTNGSDAIINTQIGSANSADPSLTMSALSSTGRNSVIAAFINGVNTFGGTEESGWTVTSNGGYATPDTGGFLMYRHLTTDNTPTVTATSGNWAGFAIELHALNKRKIITN